MSTPRVIWTQTNTSSQRRLISCKPVILKVFPLVKKLFLTWSMLPYIVYLISLWTVSLRFFICLFVVFFVGLNCDWYKTGFEHHKQILQDHCYLCGVACSLLWFSVKRKKCFKKNRNVLKINQGAFRFWSCLFYQFRISFVSTIIAYLWTEHQALNRSVSYSICVLT